MSKCIGCGIELQTTDSLGDGYVENIEYELCKRCFLIKNYGQNKDITRTNIDYIGILNKIDNNDLVVYVSSLLTLNLDYIDKFKNVLLVLTKRDILPKSIKDVKIINYVKNKYSNILDIVIVSAYKKSNLDILYDKINQYGQNRDVYFVGITNSGKSTLLNEMTKSFNGSNGNITMSNYPSTTLDVIDVKLGDHNVKDTPGIKNIKKINSKKEIKPITFQIKGKGAILIDEIIRIEYVTDESSMTFYVSNNLNVKSISLNNPRLLDCEYKKIQVGDNQDVVIEDVGFIKCTKKVDIIMKSINDMVISVRDKLV